MKKSFLAGSEVLCREKGLLLGEKLWKNQNFAKSVKRTGPEVICRAFHRHLGNKSGQEMEKGQMKNPVTEG